MELEGETSIAPLEHFRDDSAPVENEIGDEDGRATNCGIRVYGNLSLNILIIKHLPKQTH